MSKQSQKQVQIFGSKKSAASRAAERFFKERGYKVHLVDVKQKPPTKGELSRFVQKFGLNDLLDTDSKAYADSNLAYLHITSENLLSKMLENPALLRLPLVRCGKVLAVGEDTAAWRQMAESPE